MLPLTWYICTAQKLIFKKCVLDFSHAYGVWEMHICIEIIFSELNFRVCQIYKYHYCKDIFLEIDFWHSLFQFHFSHLCHQPSFGLVLSNAFIFGIHVQRLNFSVVLLRQPSLKMKRSKWGALFNKHRFALRHVARKTYHPPFSSLNSKQNHITWFSCYFVPLLKKEVLCFWTSRTSLRHIKFPVDVPFQSSCCGSAVTLCHSKNTHASCTTIDKW